MSDRMKVAFVGHGGCGKDTAAEMFKNLSGLHYIGSISWMMLPYVAARLNMAPQNAWDMRRQMRDCWRREIDAYQQGDSARCVRELVAQADIVTGLRRKRELQASLDEGLLNHVIWIYSRGAADPTVEFGPEDCTDQIENFGPRDRLRRTLKKWCARHALLSVSH